MKFGMMDPSADHRLQGRHQGKADQDGLRQGRRQDARRAQVAEEQVGGEQRGEQHQHEIVALVAGPEQHAAERDGNGWEERRDRWLRRGSCRSDRKGDPPAQPEPCQQQWRAGRGVEAGPCAARGEQEAGDDRTGKSRRASRGHAKGTAAKAAGGGEESREHRQPGWNHDRGEARGKQVKGRKPSASSAGGPGAACCGSVSGTIPMPAPVEVVSHKPGFDARRRLAPRQFVLPITSRLRGVFARRRRLILPPVFSIFVRPFRINAEAPDAGLVIVE